ncbi:hypothetical protein X551_02511 [Methylibium sp. T29]|nr:hypothetical protein X551_02511 [Methylibium sp. T29]EWS59007.1 hypothetical protein Y694_03163 [Methylibium sp. T29-B]
MRLDDRAADRQAQAHAGGGRLALAAHELLEQRLLSASRQARAKIAHADDQLLALHPGADRHRAAGGRVLRGVLQQVAQHALDQRRIEAHQRQAIRQLGAHRVARQGRAKRAQRATHHLLDRLPLPVELHRAALQSRHVEQLADHRVQAPRLRAECPRHLLRLALRAVDQGVGQAVERRQRRAQVVRQRRQQRVAQALRLDLDRRLLRHLDVVHALQGDRGQHRKGLELAALLGDQQQPRLRGLQRQHAARAHRRLQRQVEPGGAGQGVGPESGRVAVVEHPLGRAEVQAGRIGAAARPLQATRLVLQEGARAAPEFTFDRLFGRVDDLVGQQFTRQVAGQFEQRPRARLAVRCDAGLVAQAGGELAGEQPDHQHHRERQQVLHVGHRERQLRYDEEEVEGGDVQEGRQHRWAAAEAQRHAHHREQEQHHDVGELEHRLQGQRHQRGQGAGRRRPEVALGPAGREAAFSLALARHRHGVSLAFADFDQIHVGRQPRQPLREGVAPPPGAFAVVAHQQLGEVVLARMRGQRGRHILRRQHRRDRAQLAGELHRLQDALALRGRQALQRRCLDVDRVPGHRELLRQARGTAHHVVGVVARPDAAQQRGLGLPHRRDGLLDAIGLHVVLDAVGGAPQRQLAQRHQVALAEEVPDRPLRLRRQVDLAGLEPLDQLVGRRVDQYNLVGAIEEGVGQGLVHADAGDAAHHVVQALQVLHVERGVDVDAGIEQFLHVLPALGVARA